MRGFLKRNFLIFYNKSIIYILSVRFRSIGPQTPYSKETTDTQSKNSRDAIMGI
ncbi:hypothetical protein AI2866V1_4576 (plasmid) [Enterobacter cloacae]|nr:hypothetical protein AI2866V1_4576 [Enterobacter cloacae]CAH5547471.1 hypothetical protein AI2866V1_4576 [Enterobacter cloacae]